MPAPTLELVIVGFVLHVVPFSEMMITVYSQLSYFLVAIIVLTAY